MGLDDLLLLRYLLKVIDKEIEKFTLGAAKHNGSLNVYTNPFYRQFLVNTVLFGHLILPAYF